MNAEPNSKPIHELEEKIALASSVRERVDALNQLAWQLRICQPERAHNLCQDATRLAKSSGHTTYTSGIADSLITLAFLDGEEGNLETSVSRCMEALSYLEDNPSNESLIAAWYTLGWTYFYSGNYPAALEFGLKALNKAEEAGSKETKAWTLDLAATTFKEPTKAIPMYQKALKLFEELNDVEGQVRTLNNCAFTLAEMGEYSIALEYGQKGLHLAQEARLNRDEININGTLGDIYIAMGDFVGAGSFLKKAKFLVKQYGRDIGYLYILISLGEVFIAQKKFDVAEQELLEALEIARQTDMRNEQSRCHQLLSLACEQRDQLGKALEHYKYFHSLKESVAGEGVVKQISALKMAHQIETAQRDAEIERLRNEKLQLELEEHKRMHIILENLATRDPLTNLYNRRHFLSLAEQEWRRAHRYKRPISVLMFDLDHFKNINDTYGHSIGDQALITVAGIIQATLRATEIAGRYGGDEFAVILPETIGQNGLVVGKRIHSEISNQVLRADTNSIKLSVSIGVAEALEENREQVKTLYELINQADKALYISKKSANQPVSLYADS